MLLTIDIAEKNWRFLFNVAVHFFFSESLFFHKCKMFVAGLVNVVSITENANGDQNRHGSQRRCSLHKTKVVRLDKKGIM